MEIDPGSPKFGTGVKFKAETIRDWFDEMARLPQDFQFLLDFSGFRFTDFWQLSGISSDSIHRVYGDKCLVFIFSGLGAVFLRFAKKKVNISKLPILNSC